MNHRILNLKTDTVPRNALFVARPSPLGNPYAIGSDGDRDTVIEKYRVWLGARIRERDPVVCTELLGISENQPLACHCAPQRCHAEIITQVLDNGVQDQLRAKGSRSFTYAGIGSRSTPEKVLSMMTKISERLEARGYTLYSGGAAGADEAFANGCTKKSLFLPWAKFRGVESPYDCPSSEAFRVAAVVHPYWESCKNAAQSLLARNTHQILGPDLRSPVDFVVCWTPDGCETEAQRSPKTGGTGQAIALASRWGIPVYNLLHGQKALDRLTLQVKSIN